MYFLSKGQKLLIKHGVKYGASQKNSENKDSIVTQCLVINI